LVTIFPSCEDVHKAKKLSVIFPIFQKLRKCVIFRTKIKQFVSKSTLSGKMFKTSVEELHHLHAAPFPATIFYASLSSSALDSYLLYRKSIYFKQTEGNRRVVEIFFFAFYD
jgi:hypothetical protein